MVDGGISGIDSKLTDGSEALPKAPMHLLEPHRMPADEGLIGGLCVAFPYSRLSRSTQRRDALPFPVLLFVLRA